MTVSFSSIQGGLYPITGASAHEGSFGAAWGEGDYVLVVRSPCCDYVRSRSRSRSEVVGMSKQIERNPSRISFNPKNVDVAALDEIADSRDVSRAELIRDTLRDLIDEPAESDAGTVELHTPDDEELCEAYEALLRLSDHPLGVRPVTVEEAKDRLYSTSCGKSSVKRRLLEPLDALGFVTVRSGRVFVHRRTQEAVEAAETQAENEFRRLDTGKPGAEPLHCCSVRTARATEVPACGAYPTV